MGFLDKVTWDSPREGDLVARQSTYESMTLCPARVGYSTHPDFDGSPSEPMFFGTSVHSVIDIRINNPDSLIPYNAGLLKSIIEALAIADDYTAPIGVRFIEEVMRAFSDWESFWWKPIGSKLQGVKTETMIVRPLGKLSKSKAVWVQGTPDCVHRDGIVDWKTAGQGWDDGKATVRIQAPTYVWLEQDRFEWHAKVPFDYLVWDRRRKHWDTHSVIVEPHHIDSALKTLWEVARTIDAGIFVPTPAAPSGKPGRGWWCSKKFCGAWNICEFKHIVADGHPVTITRKETA